MPTCPKCGAEIREDDRFCRSCGATLPEKRDERLAKESYAREREMCFGAGARRRDLSGLISLGLFLLVLGVTFAVNPNLVSDFVLWIEHLTDQKILLRPPQSLINGATMFFALVGLSDFLVAGVRFTIGGLKRRALADVLSGIALVLFSYLIYLYGIHALAWQTVVIAEVVSCGLLIIIYGLVFYAFVEKP